MRAKVAIRPALLPDPIEPSPLVEIKATVATWPPDLQVEWAERAAIIEYMGRETREDAERQAFDQLDPDSRTRRRTH